MLLNSHEESGMNETENNSGVDTDIGYGNKSAKSQNETKKLKEIT